jgi:hypothetical protein
MVGSRIGERSNDGGDSAAPESLGTTDLQLAQIWEYPIEASPRPTHVVAFYTPFSI